MDDCNSIELSWPTHPGSAFYQPVFALGPAVALVPAAALVPAIALVPSIALVAVCLMLLSHSDLNMLQHYCISNVMYFYNLICLSATCVTL